MCVCMADVEARGKEKHRARQWFREEAGLRLTMPAHHGTVVVVVMIVVERWCYCRFVAAMARLETARAFAFAFAIAAALARSIADGSPFDDCGGGAAGVDAARAVEVQEALVLGCRTPNARAARSLARTASPPSWKSPERDAEPARTVLLCMPDRFAARSDARWSRKADPGG